MTRRWTNPLTYRPPPEPFEDRDCDVCREAHATRRLGHSYVCSRCWWVAVSAANGGGYR
jgi:hypothetical protein